MIKKIIPVIIIIVFLVTNAFAQFAPMPDLGLAKLADSPQPVLTPEQKWRLGSKKECPSDDKIIAELDGVRYAVPRHFGVAFSVRNSVYYSDLNYDRLGFPCTRNLLKDVLKIVVGNLTLKKISPQDRNLTKYDEYKKEIEYAVKANQIEYLSSGVKKFPHLSKPLEIYILPADKAPTLNGQPIAIACDFTAGRATVLTDHCEVSYIHPNGIYFQYVFWPRDYRQSSFLNADQDARAKLDRMVKEAKMIPARE